jgi:organic radical activating enzyme
MIASGKPGHFLFCNGTCSYCREAEIWAERKGKKEKSVFEQLDTLELAANGPKEHK